MKMFKIALLLSLIIIINAKLSETPDFMYLESWNRDIPTDLYKNLNRHETKIEDNLKEKLLVLHLENIGYCDLKLRLANRYENEDFYKRVQPIIEGYERRHGEPKPKKQSSNQLRPEIDAKIVKAQFQKLVNKFVLTMPVDQDSQITDIEVDNSVPALVIYFKGPYTCLILKHQLNQWQYFLPPPTPLPQWFFKQHVTIKDVKVPKTVENDFYKALTQLLFKIMSMPV